MKNDASKDLLLKYEQGNCSPEEVRLVEEWYNEITKENAGTPFEQNIITQKLARMEQIWPSSKSRANKLVTLYRKYKPYAAAASLFFGMCIGIFLIINGRNDKLLEYDADPGTSKATITLTDGTKINVTDAMEGQISTKSNLQITKTGNGQITFKFLGNKAPEHTAKNLNTIETPKGGEYIVCLPDGSKVWLNAASTLQFPTTFAYASKREVQLSGEAYFQVFKDKAHPFVVSSAKQKVQVLGTHFNISSYPDDADVKTTLLEGSVKVTTLHDNKPSLKAATNTSLRGSAGNEATLKPGQQSITNGATLKVQDVDAENQIDWHDGSFNFNDEPLADIMKKLGRWYNLNVVYQDEAMKYKTLAGSASRYAKISDILCQLEATGRVHFKIKGKEITVMK